ncbi:MAG: efflux RND transporter periplasmic adaptor subunit [Desulfobacterales bacterium]|nr:efflux RND transporter periplasmic adaptor subunit [Desulfobacterales bacterium]
MDDLTPPDIMPEQLDRQAYTGGRSKWVKAVLSAVILVFGVLAMNYLLGTATKAKRRVPTPSAPLVRVQKIFPGPQSVTVEAMGTVIPAREMSLEARVSGEIVDTHPDFVEGGFIKKGEMVVRLDDADYQLALVRARSAVANARYALALEQGRQDVARREWALMNDNAAQGPEDGDLALRKPHLEKAMADLAASGADLRQAELQQERTRIVAPFNAIIRTRYVTVGSQVAVQERLADLVAADQYRVRVSVSADRLGRIDIPRHLQETGAAATVYYRGNAIVRGEVVRLLGDLETEGRMARLLIAVDDPLVLHRPNPARPPLLLGEFVRVAIEGRPVASAFRIPRAALRDNASVWIAAADNTLEIRTVTTLWRDKETVLVDSGLSPGERLIVSNLAAPARGMALAIEGAEGRSGTGPGDGAQGKTP